ncbi:MAG: radical SAM protein [Sphaerochaeta sp.]|jgi:spore photoproduct lyase|uniref:SPL family radical SAM protein n=1 Tax=Sphaerochaeta sp. TaxID=1972642 RepID=UPI002FCBEC08
MDHPLFASLPPEEQAYLLQLDERYQFSFQQQRQLIESACDLAMWKAGSLKMWIDETSCEHVSGKKRAGALLSDHLQRMERERSMPTRYQDFEVEQRFTDKYRSLFVSTDKLMGRCPCPVDGEKTRCCNLKTLDVVQQCAFGCSYCSIQSFYNSHEIRVVKNLSQRLQDLELPEETWHIGTGQSSDSLLWGNDYGTLDALSHLARRYPELIIELKTKSHRSDYLKLDLPMNMVSTWSLNAPTIIEKEEHLTATLQQRLDAAKQARDKGRIIGFHLHPMVYFDGWQEEYGQLIEEVTRSFRAEEVMLFSLGTLTFTKAVLRQMRADGHQSRILDMQLTPASGKYSYPLETKERMFRFVYEQFPDAWKQGTPFFYLCMEDPSLWEPVFGFSYPDDRTFEAAMKRAYQGFLQQRRSRI